MSRPASCCRWSRERGFDTLEYERLFIDEIDDAVMLAKHAAEYRLEYNQIRPHEAIAFNRPLDLHLGLADQKIPTFRTKRSCQLLTRDILTQGGPLLLGSWRITRALPDARHRAGDRHLEFYETRDNLRLDALQSQAELEGQ